VGRYSIRIKPSAVKEIEAVPLKKDRQRIIEHISRLADNPRPDGCEKLSGQEKYRVRQGRYRILYSIADEDLIVYAVKVGRRKDVYNSSN
jgi:mRNA interferase RelE/StbE